MAMQCNIKEHLATQLQPTIPTIPFYSQEAVPLPFLRQVSMNSFQLCGVLASWKPVHPRPSASGRKQKALP